MTFPSAAKALCPLGRSLRRSLPVWILFWGCALAAPRQTLAQEATGLKSGIRATEPTKPDQIRDAIEALSSPQFARRQAAYRLLVGMEIEAIEPLHQAALREDLSVAERCVRALVEIARDDEATAAVVTVLEQLAESDESKSAALAKSEARRLKMTDEERAIIALEAAGVRIHRTKAGDPYSVVVMRDKDLVWLKYLPSLRSVSLLREDITDAGVRQLIDCKQIQSLSLYRTSITDASLSRLHELTSLSSLSLSGNRFSSTGIRMLRKANNLRSLIWHSEINDEQLHAIGDLRQVTVLNFSHVVPTESFADVINRMEQLTRLGLSINNATDQSCERLSNVNVPMSLSMMNANSVTATGWKQLQGIKVESLMVYRSGLSDEDMPLIGGIRSLTNLTLYDADITDDGLLKLQHLTKLRYLSLRSTQATEQGCERLKQELPQLRTVRVESNRGQANKKN